VSYECAWHKSCRPFVRELTSTKLTLGLILVRFRGKHVILIMLLTGLIFLAVIVPATGARAGELAASATSRLRTNGDIRSRDCSCAPQREGELVRVGVEVRSAPRGDRDAQTAQCRSLRRPGALFRNPNGQSALLVNPVRAYQTGAFALRLGRLAARRFATSSRRARDSAVPQCYARSALLKPLNSIAGFAPAHLRKGACQEIVLQGSTRSILTTTGLHVLARGRLGRSSPCLP